MTNRTLYLSVLAFAAAAALNTGAKAEEAQFDSASLMQKINSDLDQQNQQFTLALVEQTGAKFETRMAKIENVFAPLTQPAAFDFSVAQADAEADIAFAAVTKAEFEISKKVANMENPFEPRLPMPPVMFTIDNDEY